MRWLKKRKEKEQKYTIKKKQEHITTDLPTIKKTRGYYKQL